MDWMYKKDELDQKEYLLGKKIGAAPAGAGPNTNVPSAYDIPGAIFKFDNDRAQTRAENDMKTKMREDPLYRIREREEEVKKKVLRNPVKMKELQKQQAKIMAKAIKKEKKDKKKKKKDKYRGGEADGSSDDELLKQYMAALSKKKSKQQQQSDSGDEWEARPSCVHGPPEPGLPERRLQEHLQPKREPHDLLQPKREPPDSGGEVESRAYGLLSKSDGSKRKQAEHKHSSQDIGSRGSGSPKRKTDKQYEDEGRAERSHKRRPEQSRDAERQKDRSGRERDKDRRDRQTDGSRHERRQRDSNGKDKERTRHRHRSPEERKHKSRSPRHSPQRKRSPSGGARKRLSSAEREQKLREMTQNATWRDEERASNVKRYASDDKREQTKLEAAGGSFSESYLNPMMVSHAAGSTLQERIRRNKFNLQRTRTDLDKNSYQK